MKTGWDRAFRIVLVVAFVAMAAELILLVRQNRQLKFTNSALEQRLSAASQGVAPALRIGDTVPALEMFTLDGDSIELGYDDRGRRSVLMVFSPQCPACEQNMDNWTALERAHESQPIDFYYIAAADPEDTRGFLAGHDVRGQILLTEVEAFASYKVTHTPTTIVVGPGGVVEQVWVGVLPRDALGDSLIAG